MMPSSLQNKIAGFGEGAPQPLAPVLVANRSSIPAPVKELAPLSSNERKKEESDSPFAVSVTDVYEGPLDLLLDLIRKQDIDIYDIPIARITEQYLAYVEKIRELDVNVAADFI
jgi:segregation and condensation protein A